VTELELMRSGDDRCLYVLGGRAWREGSAIVDGGRELAVDAGSAAADASTAATG
jgi:hypothetical protein